jgi:hypothetical protein
VLSAVESGHAGVGDCIILHVLSRLSKTQFSGIMTGEFPLLI